MRANFLIDMFNVTFETAQTTKTAVAQLALEVPFLEMNCFDVPLQISKMTKLLFETFTLEGSLMEVDLQNVTFKISFC